MFCFNLIVNSSISIQPYKNYYNGSFTSRPSNVRYYEPQNSDNTTKTIIAAGLLQGIALFLNKASHWCGNKLMQGKEFTTADNIKQVAENMVKNNKLNVSVDFIDHKNIKEYSQGLQNALLPVARGENAFYAHDLKLAVAPKSKPSLILHELGHAINANKGKFLRFLQKSRIWAVSAPTALVMLNDSINNATPQNRKKNFIERNAGLLGFAAFLPTIIEEGLASIRGAKAAKNILGKTVNLKPLKRNYFFAWMTYLISGIGLGVAAKQAVLTNKQ